MHPNPAFRQTPADRNLAFARARGFGIVAVNAPQGPLLAHVPFLLAADGASADLHLARSNPILALLPAPAVVAVSGSDGYISPDWYGLPDQVPTWNYVAVHLRGTLQPLPDTEMPEMLERQSAAMEGGLAPKPPWTMDKMSPGTAERMMRGIRPCRLQITQCDGTWKLSQNKPDLARLAAADQAERSHMGLGTQDLAALMRTPPER